MDAWLELDRSAHLYEKELLPIGKLVKWVDGAKNVLNTTIRRDFLDRIVDNFKKFRDVGQKVRIFKTHQEDPDNTRGEVRDVFVKKNSNGDDSLFIKAKFNDDAAVKLAMDNDVSAFIPPRFKDSKGNFYDSPLRHVAITADPVVAGLEGWSGPLVLAFEDGPTIKDDGKGGIDVNALLDSLADELSLDYTNGSSQADKLQLVLGAVQALKTKAVDAEGKLQLALGREVDESSLTLSFPAVLVGQMKKSRVAQIDGLVLDRTFSSAMGESMKKRYCSNAAIQLDLSLDNEETQFDRDVEFAKQLAKDRPIKTEGRKTIALSRDPSSNPVTADAQRRAEAAAKAAK